MVDRPILMSAPMVRACLREIEQPGTGKTQTRRVLNPQPAPQAQVYRVGRLWDWRDGTRVGSARVPYAVDDRLYVREAWRTEIRNDDISPRELRAGARAYYVAGGGSEEAIPECAGRYRHGMHMPRWASRITLIVTEVRVQRLQDISAEDAAAEGVDRSSRKVRQIDLFGATKQEREAIYLRACKWEFEELWDSINAERGHPWIANPWVVAVTFRPILGNIDTIEERTPA